MTSFSYNVLPVKFLELVDEIIPAQLKEQVLLSYCQKRPTTFRTNTLKIATSDLITKLDQSGIQFEVVSWLPDAFILFSPYKEFTETDIYQNGLVYVQSLSSMIPPLVLDPKFDNKICDLTAAPGSKTSQIAALMKNSGEILANDLSRVRLYKLEHNLKLLGVKNTKISHTPGQLLWQKYPEYFDKTLIDTPCSLEGTFCTLDPKSFSTWSSNKVKQLSQMQKFLLRSAVSLTKVGGEIVYSTCTLSPQENEEVIDWLLKKEAGRVELLPINLKIDNPIMLGLKAWGHKTFSQDLEKTLRILPSNLMEGFFLAKFKKLDSSLN